MGRKPNYSIDLTRNQGELLWKLVDAWMARGMPSLKSQRLLRQIRDKLEDALPAPNVGLAEKIRKNPR